MLPPIMRTNAQFPQKTPIYASAGVGYVIIPASEIDRETYINNCMRTSTVSIQAGNGRGIYHNVPISTESLQIIEFPESPDKFGTPVAWIVDDKLQWPIVICTLDLDNLGTVTYGQRLFRKQIGKSIIEISADANESELNITVVGTSDTPAELNINVTSTNSDSKIKVNSDNEFQLTANNSVSVISNGKIEAKCFNPTRGKYDMTLILEGNKLKYSTGDEESTFEVEDGVAKFNGGELGALVKIEELKENLESLKQYCESLKSAISSGLQNVGESTAASGTKGKAAFELAMSGKTIDIKDMADNAVLH